MCARRCKVRLRMTSSGALRCSLHTLTCGPSLSAWCVAGELFVRTLVQRSAMRLANDVAPRREQSAGRGAQHSSLGRIGGRVSHAASHSHAPGKGYTAGNSSNIAGTGYNLADSKIPGNGYNSGSSNISGNGIARPGMNGAARPSANGVAGAASAGAAGRNGTVAPPAGGYNGALGSDGMAPEPASTASLNQPRTTVANWQRDRNAFGRI